MEKIIFFVLLIITRSATGQGDYDQELKRLYKNTVKTIKPSEVRKLIVNGEKLTLLDTRSPEEYSVSHLECAQFFDFNAHSVALLKRIPKNEKIIVYCSVGYRSERAGEKLQKLGYENVYNIYGGIFEWKNENMPVVNKQNQPTDSMHTYNKSWSKWLKNGIKVY